MAGGGTRVQDRLDAFKGWLDTPSLKPRQKRAIPADVTWAAPRRETPRLHAEVESDKANVKSGLILQVVAAPDQWSVGPPQRGADSASSTRLEPTGRL